MLTVQRWLWDAPRWVWSVIYVLPVLLVWVAVRLFSTAAVGAALFVVLAMVFGCLGATVGYAQQRTERRATGEVPVGRLEDVLAAAGRGPLPGDEDVRAAARRLVTHRRALVESKRVSALVLLSLLGLLLVALLLTRSPLWFLAAPSIATGTALYEQVVVRRRLRERQRALRPPSWQES